MRERISTDNAAKLTELTQVQCDEITQIDWSPNGTILAVAGGKTVRLYAGTFGGQPTHTLTAHSDLVTGIAFSPDNQQLISVSADKSIKLWDISDMQIAVSEIITLIAHQDCVKATAFGPRSKYIATAGGDGLIYLWDTQTHLHTAVLRGHQQAVHSVAFALRGNILVSGGQDKTVRLWDTTAETEGTVIGTHDDEVQAVCVNSPGTMIASAGKEGAVRLWDALSGDLYATIIAHTGGVTSVVFSPYGELLATGGQDQVLRVWNVQRVLAEGKAAQSDALITLAGHQKPILSLAFNPPGTLLASGGGDNTVRLWSVPHQPEEL